MSQMPSELLMYQGNRRALAMPSSAFGKQGQGPRPFSQLLTKEEDGALTMPCCLIRKGMAGITASFSVEVRDGSELHAVGGEASHGQLLETCDGPMPGEGVVPPASRRRLRQQAVVFPSAVLRFVGPARHRMLTTRPLVSMSATWALAKATFACNRSSGAPCLK